MTFQLSAGVYPILPDETCRLLAVDFDKGGWRQDVAAFRGAGHPVMSGENLPLIGRLPGH